MTELNSLPEDASDISTDFVMYEDSTATVVVETFENGTVVSLSMYIEDHDKFSDIVPDDAQDCEKHDGLGEPSTVSDLPGAYESIFKAAADAVQEQYGVSRQYTSMGLGTCTNCMPNADGACGTLTFVEFFEK